jgi:hypothetical protein
MCGVTRTLVVLVALAACGGTPTAPPAQIVDLSTSAAELRADFNAHSGEARFVTLLSPT